MYNDTSSELVPGCHKASSNQCKDYQSLEILHFKQRFFSQIMVGLCSGTVSPDEQNVPLPHAASPDAAFPACPARWPMHFRFHYRQPARWQCKQFKFRLRGACLLVHKGNLNVMGSCLKFTDMPLCLQWVKIT